MKQKSTNQVVGAVAFLAVAGIVVKILGLICKIPLVYIIGEDGMGYFNSAYTIYNLFFMLSNAGLPVAISILVCEQRAKTTPDKHAIVFRTIVLIVFLIGLVGALVLGLGAGVLADFIGNRPSEVCILVMAPVFLFVCIAGGLRGYFQGLSKMVPTGVSQLIEALIKAILGVALALYGVKRGYSLPICAALALVGIAVGSFLSMAYLLFLTFRQGAWKEAPDLPAANDVSRLKIAGRLFRIALPVTLGSLVLSLSNFMDLAIVMRGLQAAGLDGEAANRLYGNYTSLAIPLFNLPTVLIMPISYAVVPRVTEARVAGDEGTIGKTATGALKAASIITLPCVFGLFLLSKPILLLLFEKESALRAAPLLSLLGPAVFFVGIVTVTGSLLQASGKQMLPVISMVCGAVCKLIVSMLLIPRMGIVGAPIGTLCCYVVIAIINLFFAVRFCRMRLWFLGQFWAPLVAGFGCALVGRLLYGGLTAHLGTRLSAMISLACTCLVYFVLLIMFRALGREEIEALPLPKALKTFIYRFLPEKERNSHCENSQGINKSASLRI